MQTQSTVYHLGIGELIVSSVPSVLSTVLGSCVSVCIMSRQAAMGGMTHYALPEAPSRLRGEEAFRYGDLAILGLIEELQALTGENANQFVAKITGGATTDLSGSLASMMNIGPLNVAKARDVLTAHRIPIVGEHVGGLNGRKVLFHTHTGRLQVAALSERYERIDGLK